MMIGLSLSYLHRLDELMIIQDRQMIRSDLSLIYAGKSEI